MNNQYTLAATLLLLTTLYIRLCWKVILQRRHHKAPYTHAIEDRAFQAIISAQRNFNDYTPFTLVILLFLYQLNVNPLLFAILCGFLVIGRYSHAFGMLFAEQHEKPIFRPRIIGMQCTFFSIVASSVTGVIYAFLF